MNPLLISLGMFVLACGGILWRMSSILTKLESSIERLSAELARVHKDREGVEAELAALTVRVAAVEKEVADARVVDAKFDGRISSLDRKRSIRPTEYQMTDSESLHRRKTRPRK